MDNYDWADLLDDLLMAAIFLVCFSFIAVTVYAFGQWLGGQL